MIPIDTFLKKQKIVSKKCNLYDSSGVKSGVIPSNAG